MFCFFTLPLRKFDPSYDKILVVLIFVIICEILVEIVVENLSFCAYIFFSILYFSLSKPLLLTFFQIIFLKCFFFQMNCLKQVELQYPEWKQKLQVVRASKQLESKKVFSDEVKTIKNVKKIVNPDTKRSIFNNMVPPGNETSCISIDQPTLKILTSTPYLKSKDKSEKHLIQKQNDLSQNPVEHCVSENIKKPIG